MILSPILTLDPAKVERDLAFLMDCLSEVLEEAREHALARPAPVAPGRPRISLPSTLSAAISPERLSQAYSIAFHLLSMVEQNAAIQQQRLTEAAHGLSAMQALWGAVSAAGCGSRAHSGIRSRRRCGACSVELVLTAHPTEAKRTIVLEHHRSLYLLLVKRENQVWTPYEQRAIREEIKTLLSLLWRTRRDLPAQARCRRGAPEHHALPLYSVSGRVAGAGWPVAPGLDASGFRPRAAPGAGESPAFPPEHLGGRRPGWTSARHGGRDPSDAGRSAPARVAAAAASARGARPAGEPFGSPRAAAGCVARSRASSGCATSGERGRRFTTSRGRPGGSWSSLMLAQASPGERLSRGRTPAARRRTISARRRVARGSPRAVRLARGRRRVARGRRGGRARDSERADVRVSPGVAGHPPEQRASTIWRSRSCRRRRDSSRPISRTGPRSAGSTFLDRELASPRPFLRADASAGPEADAVLGTFRVLAEQLRDFGLDGLGALIVSMTRQHVRPAQRVPAGPRSRPGGQRRSGGLACRLPVVPLFETIDDLERSPEILRAFLQHPVTRRSLEQHRLDDRRRASRPAGRWSATATATRTAASSPVSGRCTARRRRSFASGRRQACASASSTGAAAR